MTIPELRQAAAVSIGIGLVKDDKVYVYGKLFKGTAADYASLNAGDQINLTDRMAGMIKADPTKFTQQQVAVASERVNSPFFQQPLAATSYINVTSELIKSGELQRAMVAGASSYLNNVNKILLTVGALATTLILIDYQQKRI